MRFFHRKQKQRAQLSRKELEVAIQQELGGYLKRDELHEQLIRIKQDEQRQKKWATLSMERKAKFLDSLIQEKRDVLYASLLPRQKLEMRYLLQKKGGGHGKK